jgi:competence ComEA-like helix-hairpin-helix protein
MTRRISRLLLVAACGLWSIAVVRTIEASDSVTTQASAPTVPKEFPEGPGREVVARVCRECHAPTDITRRRESRRRWSAMVEAMIEHGAALNDTEFEAVVSYLSAVLGRKVPINQATAIVIAETFDFSAEVAAAIVAYRSEHGPFKDLSALARVPGVDLKRIEEQQANLDFTIG